MGRTDTSMEDLETPVPSFWRAFLPVLLPGILLLAGALTWVDWNKSAQHEELARLEERSLVTLESRVFCNELSSRITDCMFLTDLVGRYLPEGAGLEGYTERAARVLISFLDRKAGYDQVRILSPEGMELVRIDSRDGDPIAIERDKLQDKSERDYYQAVRRLKPGQVLISRFDLNVERGKIEAPHVPMIRFAGIIMNPDKRRVGYMVLNFKGDSILTRLRETSLGSYGKVYLTNLDGYWLLAPPGAEPWGFMFPEGRDWRIDKLYPDAWKAIWGTDQGQYKTSRGLFTFDTVSLAECAPFMDQSGSSLVQLESWKIISIASLDSLRPWESRWFLWASAALAGVVFLLAWFWAQVRVQKAQARARLVAMATTDALTGLANRRRFLELGGRETERRQRHGTPLALAMLDVDHFKRVNDTHGHEAGDKVLAGLAALGRETIRDLDVMGRLGGEEFAILMPDTDLEGAVILAERLRQRVEAAEIPTAGGALRITISIGVAFMTPDIPDLEALIRRADDAMYRAKEGGRNRVVRDGEFLDKAPN